MKAKETYNLHLDSLLRRILFTLANTSRRTPTAIIQTVEFAGVMAEVRTAVSLEVIGLAH